MVDYSINVLVYVFVFMYSCYGNRKLKIFNYVIDIYRRVGVFFFI